MSRYRCCCWHVETGALIIGIVGLLSSLALPFPNPFGVVASLFLLLAYCNHCRALYTVYIVMMCIAIVWSILTLVAAIVTAVKPEWYLQEVAKSTLLGSATNEQIRIKSIVVAVIIFLTIILHAWFVSVAVRAREYVSRPFRRPVADAHNAGYVTDGGEDRYAQSYQVSETRTCSTAC
ncbi:hypothetical protein AAVH_31417 [Aphelenchoides avenae]|nr:hypothetical protein AAVH_31417 [Aphelenchus avenae]